MNARNNQPDVGVGIKYTDARTEFGAYDLLRPSLRKALREHRFSLSAVDLFRLQHLPDSLLLAKLREIDARVPTLVEEYSNERD